MAERSVRKQCSHEGCREFAFYRFSSLREMQESREAKLPWTCTRHTKPEELLTPTNLSREFVAESKRGAAGLLFWGHSGFMFGPGFKAFCDDFPQGTRLIVTARIELPKEFPHG